MGFPQSAGSNLEHATWKGTSSGEREEGNGAPIHTDAEREERGRKQALGHCAGPGGAGRGRAGSGWASPAFLRFVPVHLSLGLDRIGFDLFCILFFSSLIHGMRAACRMVSASLHYSRSSLCSSHRFACQVVLRAGERADLHRLCRCPVST